MAHDNIDDGNRVDFGIVLRASGFIHIGDGVFIEFPVTS